MAHHLKNNYSSSLNIKFRKKLVRYCIVWPRYLDTKKIGGEVLGELRNVELEEIKLSEKVTTEEILEYIGEKGALLSNILHRKTNWTGHILHSAIEGQMTEVKREGSGRRTQLLNDLRNRRCFDVKEEAKDGNDSLSQENKEEMQVLLHNSMVLLTNKY